MNTLFIVLTILAYEAFFTSVLKSLSASFLNDTQTKIINVTANSPHKSCLGSISDASNQMDMKAPFYIVPLQPEDENEFKKYIRVDVDTGHIYSNEAALKSTQVYSFSALSISTGQAIVLVINVVEQAAKISTTTTKATTLTRSTTKSIVTYVSSRKNTLSKAETTFLTYIFPKNECVIVQPNEQDHITRAPNAECFLINATAVVDQQTFNENSSDTASSFG